MRVRKIIMPVGGTWRGRVLIEEITDDEKEKFAAFGPKALQVGGTFTDGDTTFELANKEVLVPHTVHVARTFPSSDDATEATLWVNTVVDRLSTLVDDLLGTSLSGQTDTTVILPLDTP